MGQVEEHLRETLREQVSFFKVAPLSRPSYEA